MAEFDPAEILRALRRHNVEYIVIGGFAASAQGSHFVTTDIDIAPRRAANNLRRLAAALRDLDARIRTEGAPDGVPFDRSAEFLEEVEILHLTTRGGDLDISFRPSGTAGYEDLKRDSIAVEILGVPTHLASLADVIRSKEAAGKPKDLLTVPALRRLLEEPFAVHCELLADGQVLLTLASIDPRVTPLAVRCIVRPRGREGTEWRSRGAVEQAAVGPTRVRFPADFGQAPSLPLEGDEYKVEWVQARHDRKLRILGTDPLAITRFAISSDGRFSWPT